MDNRMWLVHIPTGVGVFIANDSEGSWFCNFDTDKVGAKIQVFLDYLDDVDQRYHLQLVQELTHKWDDLGVLEESGLRQFKNLRENGHRHMMVPPPQQVDRIPVTLQFNNGGIMYHQLMASVPAVGEYILLPEGLISSKMVECKVDKVLHFQKDSDHHILVYVTQVE